MAAASGGVGRGWRWPRRGDAAAVEANGRCTSRLGKIALGEMWGVVLEKKSTVTWAATSAWMDWMNGPRQPISPLF
jgi:hypothetical protein